MRQLIAGLVAAAFASLGAVVLGEYNLQGVVALVSGPLLGLAITEVAVSVGRRLSRATAIVVAGISGLSFFWAVWIATDHYRDAPAVTAWIGVILAVGASFAWSEAGSRLPRSRPDKRADPATAALSDKAEATAPAPSNPD